MKSGWAKPLRHKSPADGFESRALSCHGRTATESCRQSHPLAAGTSKTQQKKFSEALKAFVHDHAQAMVVPHCQTRLTAEFASDDYHVEVSDEGELLRGHPSDQEQTVRQVFRVPAEDWSTEHRTLGDLR